MARSKKADGKLIMLALVVAPFVWLHDKIGIAGILTLIVILVVVVIVAAQSGKRRKTSKPKPSRKRTRSTRQTTVAIPAERIDDVLDALERMDTTDYLGMAAEAGHKAKAATEAGDFDGAWRLYHEQKAHYAGHAHRSEFTKAQAIALEGSVHRNLANLLRLEARHREALVHFLYYYASSPRRTKTDEKQISTYVNRAKIGSSIDDVQKFIDGLGPIPNLRAIQIECTRWQKTH